LKGKKVINVETIRKIITLKKQKKKKLKKIGKGAGRERG